MALSRPALLSIGLHTDVGLQRQGSVNEDAATALLLPQGGLFSVADGMGGHAAGEIASYVALETLSETYAATYGLPTIRFLKAVQAAGKAVHERSQKEGLDMGTTLVSVLVDKGAAHIAHVGDSRVYLLREGRLIQLTEDHSWVAQQVKEGILSAAEAESHDWRNIVLNALGSEPTVKLDFFGVGLQKGDRLLLCSDGLSGCISHDQLARLLNRPERPEIIARLLVSAANAAGGPDNITALVIEISQKVSLPSYPLLERQSGSEPKKLEDLLTVAQLQNLQLYLMVGILYITLLIGLLWHDGVKIVVPVGIIVFGVAWLWSSHQRKKAAAQLVQKAPSSKSQVDEQNKIPHD